jgi:transcriptional regulator GlxA family with amidase domain
VDSGRIATAGGLTSGIDLALHIVSRYFGVEAAQATAQYMEYTSEAWRA